MKKKLLFSATLREIKFLFDNDYLNEKGKERIILLNVKN